MKKVKKFQETTEKWPRFVLKSLVKNEENIIFSWAKESSPKLGEYEMKWEAGNICQKQEVSG